MREQYIQADALVVLVATLQPCEELMTIESKIEIISRPFVPYNFEHWKDFHDDACWSRICRFKICNVKQILQTPATREKFFEMLT